MDISKNQWRSTGGQKAKLIYRQTSIYSFSCFSCDSSIDEDFPSDDEEMFKRYDTDGDGFVTREELKAFAKKRRVSITDSVFDEMIKDADINEDGKVTFEEYTAMMNKRQLSCGLSMQDFLLIENKEMVFKNGVKNIQAEGYLVCVWYISHQ